MSSMRLDAQDEKYRAERRQRRMNTQRTGARRYLRAVTRSPEQEIVAPTGAERQLALAILEGSL